MAQQVLAFIYGENGNTWPAYSERGFPVTGVTFIGVVPPIVNGSVTIHSIIKVLGTGSDYSTSPEFYTDKTVSTLVTDSNL